MTRLQLQEIPKQDKCHNIYPEIEVVDLMIRMQAMLCFIPHLISEQVHSFNRKGPRILKDLFLLL